jgi:osmotically inducible protein OsmC
MRKINTRYKTSMTATGAREGYVVSDDGVLDVKLRRPKTNGTPEGTNPEQLFGAAYAGCFQGALFGVARDTGDDVSNSSVTAEVSLREDETGGSGLVVKIIVDVPGMDRAKVQELANSAHQRCPYSKATLGNIDVEVAAAG